MSTGRIDIHTHGMSQEAGAEVIAHGGFKPTGGYRISVPWTPQAALEYMDRQQIAAQVISMPVSFAGSEKDPEFGVRLCRLINEGHARLIADHPGRFGAFATLPADGPHVALRELAYALDELHLDGGLYTGLFRRMPRLRLILAHCGGALPALGWRIGEHTVMGRGPEDADIDPAHVAQVLRGLYYETALAGSRNSLLPTLEVTTADHILFGTDWPAAPEPTVVRNIANLTSFDGFTPQELSGVERDNALTLFPRFA